MKSEAAQRDFLAMALEGKDPIWRKLPHRFLALHTGAPEDSRQTSNEATYRGYKRARVPNDIWENMDGIGYFNRDPIQFADPLIEQDDIMAYMLGDPTTKEQMITHASIGTTFDGPGRILYVSRFDQPIRVRATKLRVPSGALMISEG